MKVGVMKRIFFSILACFMALTVTSPGAEPNGVVVIPIKGEISEAQFFFLRRALKTAESSNASAVILDMDTYGGSLSAASDMLDALSKCKLLTLTYINPNAGSAGALVALSTKKIYMSPVSAIGAAAPVSSQGADLPSTMNDKVISYFSKYFASAAEKNGYNPDIAEAFINKDKEVKIGDTVIHARGSVLTLSAQEAIRLVNNKPVLAAGIVASLDELLRKEKRIEPMQTIEPTGFEMIAEWITALSPILLAIGIIGAYLEFKLQGTMIPGMVACVAFLLFFGGHYIAGLAGWEVIGLFLIGLALVISELALHPGTIIPGVAGMMLMLGSLFWAMVDRYPEEPLIPAQEMIWLPLANLGIAVAIGIAAIMILARYLPRTNLYHRMILSRANPAGPSIPDDSSGLPGRPAPGAHGIAKSILRPSGNAVFGGTVVDVITRGEFIEQGARIRVLTEEGSRIIVEKIE